MKPVAQVFAGLAMIALAGILAGGIFRWLRIAAGGAPTPAHWVVFVICGLLLLSGWFVAIRALLRIFWKR
jgi:hypothetical protein